MAMSQRSSMGGSSRSSKGGGGTSGDKKKLILAVALFVIAGGLIAFSQGFFDSFFRSKPKVDPVQQKATEEAMTKIKEDAQRMEKEERGIIGGE